MRQIDRFSPFCTARDGVSSDTLAPPGEYDGTCAHWRYLANTIELVLPSAYLSLQPKRHLDRFSRFAQMTAECPCTLQWDVIPPPQNCPFPCADLNAHLIVFIGPTRVLNPNGMSIGSAVFLQGQVL